MKNRRSRAEDLKAMQIVLGGWRVPPEVPSAAAVEALRRVCAGRARFHTDIRRLPGSQDFEDVEQAGLVAGLEFLASGDAQDPERLYQRIDQAANARAARIHRAIGRSLPLELAYGSLSSGSTGASGVMGELRALWGEVLEVLRSRHPEYEKVWEQFVSSRSTEWPARRAVAALREAFLVVVDRRDAGEGGSLRTLLGNYLRGGGSRQHYSQPLRALIEALERTRAPDDGE